MATGADGVILPTKGGAVDRKIVSLALATSAVALVGVSDGVGAGAH
jgi:hypothetical protein